MAIDRVTVNLPEGVADLLEKRAAADKRTVSNFVACLIENDLSKAGLIQIEAPVRAELEAAISEAGGDETATRILMRATRRRRSVRH